jgi:hypothetical protein
VSDVLQHQSPPELQGQQQHEQVAAHALEGDASTTAAGRVGRNSC